MSSKSTLGVLLLCAGAVLGCPQRAHQDVTTADGATISIVAGVNRPGIVDLELGADADPVLESLAAHEEYTAALQRAQSALEHALEHEAPLSPGVLKALHRVGMVLLLGGDLGAARVVFDAVVDARMRAPDNPAEIVVAHLMAGRVARYLGDSVRAERHYAQAETMLAPRRAEHPALVATLDQFWADWWRRTDPERAIGLYRDALRRHQAFGDAPSPRKADTATWLAFALAHARRFDDAATVARGALADLKLLGLTDSLAGVTASYQLASQAVAGNRLRDAEDLLCASAAARRRLRHSGLGGFSRRAYPLVGGIDCALLAGQRGDGAAAWRTVEQFEGPTFAEFVALGRWPDVDPEGYREVAKARARVLAAQRPLSAYLDRGRAAWDDTTRPLLRALLEARTEVNVREARYLSEHDPLSDTIEDIQRLLPEKTALLGYVDSDFGLFDVRRVLPGPYASAVYVLRRDRPLAWIPLGFDPRATYEFRLTRGRGRALERLRRAAQWRGRVAVDPELDDDLRSWGQRVIDPVIGHLDGIDSLLLESYVAGLNLVRTDDGRLLGDRFDVTVVPSTRAWAQLARHPRPSRAARGSLLAVAQRSPAGAGAHASLSAENALDEPPAPRLNLGRGGARGGSPPGLRYALPEVEAAAALFPEHRVLADGPTTERSLRGAAASGELLRYEVIHFATHVVTDIIPERSALFLGPDHAGAEPEDDGLLDADEIVCSWRVEADLVTLSGCDTNAAADIHYGEALGPSIALFAAGARRVMASLWPVDDHATALLMKRFYENYTGHYQEPRFGRVAEPMPPARALREARLWLRDLTDSHGRKPFAHPVYWGGFILVGS